MIETSWRTLAFNELSFRIDKRVISSCVILVITLICTMAMSLSYGDYKISMLKVLYTLIGQGTDTQSMVIWEFRLPRILLAALVGMAISVSGALLQGITRNALADPGIIGINQGAGLAAVALLVWFDDISVHWLPLSAFLGGALTALLIYLIAWDRGSSPIRLVLVGIGFAAFASALTTVMIVFSDIERVGQAYLWLSGSVYGRGWDSVTVLFMWVIVLLPLAFLMATTMNTMLQDEHSIRALGVNIERSRLIIIVISVALASASVSAAGLFSFLGLVAPHIARSLVGNMFQGLIPVTALVGACIVVIADFIGRSIIAPNQIPAGLVTAIIGAPYFFWQMRRLYKR